MEMHQHIAKYLDPVEVLVMGQVSRALCPFYVLDWHCECIWL